MNRNDELIWRDACQNKPIKKYTPPRKKPVKLSLLTKLIKVLKSCL